MIPSTYPRYCPCSFFGLYLHALCQVSSGGPPIIDPCSTSETLPATVTFTPAPLSYYNSVEPSRYIYYQFQNRCNKCHACPLFVVFLSTGLSGQAGQLPINGNKFLRSQGTDAIPRVGCSRLNGSEQKERWRRLGPPPSGVVIHPARRGAPRYALVCHITLQICLWIITDIHVNTIKFAVGKRKRKIEIYIFINTQF